MEEVQRGDVYFGQNERHANNLRSEPGLFPCRIATDGAVAHLENVVRHEEQKALASKSRQLLDQALQSKGTYRLVQHFQRSYASWTYYQAPENHPLRPQGDLSRYGKPFNHR